MEPRNSADVVTKALRNTGSSYSARVELARDVWEHSTMVKSAKVRLLSEWLATTLAKSVGFQEKILDTTPLLSITYWRLLSEIIEQYPSLALKVSYTALYSTLFNDLFIVVDNQVAIAEKLVHTALQCYSFFSNASTVHPSVEQVFTLIKQYLRYMNKWHPNTNDEVYRTFENTLYEQSRQKVINTPFHKKLLTPAIELLMVVKPDNNRFHKDVQQLCATVIYSFDVMHQLLASLAKRVKHLTIANDVGTEDIRVSAAILPSAIGGGYTHEVIKSTLRCIEHALTSLPILLELFSTRLGEYGRQESQKLTDKSQLSLSLVSSPKSVLPDITLQRIYPFALFLEFSSLLDDTDNLYMVKTQMIEVLLARQIYYETSDAVGLWMKAALSVAAAETQSLRELIISRWKILACLDVRLIENPSLRLWSVISEYDKDSNNATIELLTTLSSVYSQSRRFDVYFQSLLENLKQVAHVLPVASHHPFLSPVVVNSASTTASVLTLTQQLRLLETLLETVNQLLAVPSDNEPALKRPKLFNNSSAVSHSLCDLRVFVPYFAALSRSLHLVTEHQSQQLETMVHLLTKMLKTHLLAGNPKDYSQNNWNNKFALLTIHNIACASLPTYATITFTSPDMKVDTLSVANQPPTTIVAWSNTQLCGSSHVGKTTAAIALSTCLLLHARYLSTQTVLDAATFEWIRTVVQNILSVHDIETVPTYKDHKWFGTLFDLTEYTAVVPWWLLILQHIDFICCFVSEQVCEKLANTMVTILCSSPPIQNTTHPRVQYRVSSATWDLLSCSAFFEIVPLRTLFFDALLRCIDTEQKKTSTTGAVENALAILFKCPAEYVPKRMHERLCHMLLKVDESMTDNTTILTKTRKTLCRFSSSVLCDKVDISQLLSIYKSIPNDNNTDTLDLLYRQTDYLVRHVICDQLNRLLNTTGKRYDTATATIATAINVIKHSLTETTASAPLLAPALSILEVLTEWIISRHKKKHDDDKSVTFVMSTLRTLCDVATEVLDRLICTSKLAQNTQESIGTASHFQLLCRLAKLLQTIASEHAFLASYKNFLQQIVSKTLNDSHHDLERTDLSLVLVSGIEADIKSEDRRALLLKVTSVLVQENTMTENIADLCKQLLATLTAEDYEGMFLLILDSQTLEEDAQRMIGFLDILLLLTDYSVQTRRKVFLTITPLLLNCLSRIVHSHRCTSSHLQGILAILDKLAQNKVTMRDTFMISLCLGILIDILHSDIGVRIVLEDSFMNSTVAQRLFGQIISILYGLFVNYRREITNNIPIFVQILKDLLYCFRSPSVYSPPLPTNTIIRDAVRLPPAFILSHFAPLPQTCALVYTRLLSSMEHKVVLSKSYRQKEQNDQSQQKKSVISSTVQLNKPLGRHFVHLLAEFATIQSSMSTVTTDPWYGWTISQPDILKAITHSMHIVFNVCGEYERTYLISALSNAGKNIIKALYTDYMAYYKYTGKV